MTEAQLEDLVRTVTETVVRTLLANPPSQSASLAAADQSRSCSCQDCPCRQTSPVEILHPSRLLAEEALGSLSSGSRVILRPGTLVTPLARDRARELGIELEVRVAPDPPVPTAPGQRLAFCSSRPGGSADSLLAELRRAGVVVESAPDASRDARDPDDAAFQCVRSVADGRAGEAVVLVDHPYPFLRRIRRLPGLRPVLARDPRAAAAGRTEYGGNVLVIPSRELGLTMARKTIRAWLEGKGAGHEHAG